MVWRGKDMKILNEYMLPTEETGNHIIFWPEAKQGRDGALKHPLFEIPLVKKTYKHFYDSPEYKLGKTSSVRLSPNYHLIFGVCLMGLQAPDFRLPAPDMKALTKCLKQVSVFTAAVGGSLHISTYPLYFGNWHDIQLVIRATCQGLDIIIHTEKVEPRHGIQIKDPMQRLPVLKDPLLLSP
jgi:hypothetical protein